MSSAETTSVPLARTPLYDLHVARGAKMVPFAGYEMPVQYPLGVLKEHLWTREKAGLFDVSHMGQAYLIAEDLSHATVARALEALVPADVTNLKPGQQRYSQLLADDGGILDDLMISRPADTGQDGVLNLVLNAACKEADSAHLAAGLPPEITLHRREHHGLLALQGPMAASILGDLDPAARAMSFMTTRSISLAGIACEVSRSGYTGEDGYEISVAHEYVVAITERLLSDPRVALIGLGARDSLRLEAGLCLYGHDIDTTTSPVEAGLAWSIQKRRRTEGGFPGAARIQKELSSGPKRLRVGIKPDGRAPAREGTEVFTVLGDRIGIVTSGGFGPSVNGPIAMGYVHADCATPGIRVNLMVRGKPLPAEIVTLPFTPHRYFKTKA